MTCTAPSTAPLLAAVLLSMSITPTAWTQQALPGNGLDVGPTTLADFARRDPIVGATLALPRETPDQQLRTIVRLIDLGQPVAASLVLPELLSHQLDDAQQAELVRRFGTGRFMTLIRLDSPLPDDAETQGADFSGAQEFAQACLDAASAAARDPQRIRQLVDAATSENATERQAAHTDLQSTGTVGVAACLEALAAATTEQQRTFLLQALAQLRPAVEAPLLAALAGGEGTFRRDVAELAGYLQMRSALPQLAALSVHSGDGVVANSARQALTRLGVSTTPTASDLDTLMGESIDDAIEGVAVIPNASDSGQWFTWNVAERQIQQDSFSDAELRVLSAARIARAWSEAGGPTTAEQRRRTLILALEERAILGETSGPDAQQPLQQLTTDELGALLSEAIQRDSFRSAVQSAEELGRRKDVGALLTADGRPGPLASALESDVRSVRFAALEAIMNIAPHTTFPGASHVAEALWYFALSSGEPTAIAATPVVTRATTWAGLLRGLGYDAAPATNGRSALQAASDATAAPRLAVVLLDSDLARPGAREVLFQLRNNPATSRTPVALLCSTGRLAAMQRLAEGDPLTAASSRPYADGALAGLVEKARSLDAEPSPTSEQRMQEAARALQWIGELLKSDSPYDELERNVELLRETLYVPDLRERTLEAMSNSSAAESQSALLDYASMLALPIETRQSAAKAFAHSVKRFGVLLTRSQIFQQYERYNASETADAQSQQVLGQVLDVIEGKDQS